MILDRSQDQELAQIRNDRGSFEKLTSFRNGIFSYKFETDLVAPLEQRPQHLFDLDGEIEWTLRFAKVFCHFCCRRDANFIPVHKLSSQEVPRLQYFLERHL